jgi:FtsH-binding integral membrane protein
VALVLELTPVVNLLFCALIVILGLLAYGRTKKDSPLYVAGAFLLFGLSHLATILGIADGLATPLLVLRIIGYVLILWLLYLCFVKGDGKEG